MEDPVVALRVKELLVREAIPEHACCDEDLELLFKQCENETADGILDKLKTAIMNGPLDPDGTEDSLHSFWDTNIRAILVRCLKNAKSIRNSNQDTETGQFRPNFGLLLANICVFRGEEKRKSFPGTHSKDELKKKTRWVYDPAPDILGW